MEIEHERISDLALEIKIEKNMRVYISRDENFFEYYTSILLLRDMLCEREVFEDNKVFAHIDWN